MAGSSQRSQTHARHQSHSFHPYPPPTNSYSKEEPSPPYTTSSRTYSPPFDSFSASRQGTPGTFNFGAAHVQLQLEDLDYAMVPSPMVNVNAMVNSNGGREGQQLPPAKAEPGKAKRVRTGCLTCRERHLKCDEGVPDCNNCRKSNRECKRGIRLNFIDVQVRTPPYVPPTTEWSVQILDESRLIASEYKGGLGRYPKLETPQVPDVDETSTEKTASPDHQMSDSSFSEHVSSSSAPQDNNPTYPNHVGQPPPPQSLICESVREEGMQSFTYYAREPLPPLQQPSPPNFDDDIFMFSPLESHHMNKDKMVISTNKHEYTSGCALSLSSTRTVSSPSAHSIRFEIYNSPAQMPGRPADPPTPASDDATDERDYLDSDDEIRYMQAFVDGVAPWLDSLDGNKHFANTVPYLALKSPMVLNALLACGARQMSLMGGCDEDKAERYYSLALEHLTRIRREQRSDLSECAVAAVVLNAYELMSDKSTDPLHQALPPASALIRECGWDASSGGMEAACFWASVGIEVLASLSSGSHITWDPDQWGVDLEFADGGLESGSSSASVIGFEECVRRPSIGGDGGRGRKGLAAFLMKNGKGFGEESLWVKRIFYILAKVANFRASMPRGLHPDPHEELISRQTRFAECRRLQRICNAWSNSCPRSMRPYGYSAQSSDKSLFPNVWLIKPSAILGRLFYHTSMCLLSQTNPLDQRRSGGSLTSEENRRVQQHHAHHVCGIVAHHLTSVDRRSFVAAAACSLAVVGGVLTDAEERREVLELLGTIGKETGWRMGRLEGELKRAWAAPRVVASGSSSKSDFGGMMSMPLTGLLVGSDFRIGRAII